MIDWLKNLVRKNVGGPNLDPFFYRSGYQGSLSSDPNQIVSNPGFHQTWVYSGITTIINNFNRAYPAIHLAKDEKTLDYEHPIINLMKRPNPFFQGTNFFEAIIWFLLLPTTRTKGGQVFIVGDVPTNFAKGEIPQELWVFSDALFFPVLDRSGILIGWELKTPGRQTIKYSIDEVIRINLFNKDDHAAGLSPLIAAFTAIAQDAYATEFNLNFLKNGAAPSGLITTKQPLDLKQTQEFKKLWNENAAGFKNAGKPLVLPFAVQYDQLQKTHVEFQYIQQDEANRKRILSALKLNPFAIGIENDLNRATAYMSQFQVWNNAIYPLELAITDALNIQWISHIKGGSIRFKMDKSDIEALKEDQTLKIDNAVKLIETGVPPAIAFDFLDLGIDTRGMPWMYENQSSAARLKFTEDKEEDEPTEDQEEPKEKALLITKSSDISITVDELENLSSHFIEKLFTPGEKTIQTSVIPFFHHQRNEFQNHIDDVFKGIKDQDAPLSTFKVSDILIPRPKQDKAIQKVFMPLYKSIAERVLGLTKTELKSNKVLIKALDRDSSTREILEFLDQRLSGISVLNDTSFKGVEKKVASIIAHGLKQQYTPKQMAKAIKDGVNQVYKDRVSDTMKIARTESSVVSNTIRYRMFRNLDGVNKHTWVSAEDKKVRHDHGEENGETVVVGKRFPVTGLRYPSDPSGPPEQIINCRCIAVLARGSNE